MLFYNNPLYSHGGTSGISGTTQTSGRPICISASITDCCMKGFFTGTSVTVILEGNSGALDNTGNPPAAEWTDYSNGGFTLTNNQSFSKIIPRLDVYYRTRITSITAPTGPGFFSYVPGSLVGTGGVIVAPSYPIFDSGTRTS